jgi:hypothetical protein
LLRWLELIFVFELLERWRIEQPHSFIGCGGCNGADYAHDGKCP